MVKAIPSKFHPALSLSRDKICPKFAISLCISLMIQSKRQSRITLERHFTCQVQSIQVQSIEDFPPTPRPSLPESWSQVPAPRLMRNKEKVTASHFASVSARSARADSSRPESIFHNQRKKLINDEILPSPCQQSHVRWSHSRFNFTFNFWKSTRSSVG